MTIAASHCLIRPMAVADIERVSEIERESFPTMWPQTAYKRELQRTNLAAYLVIVEHPPETDQASRQPLGYASDGPAQIPQEDMLRGFLRRAGRIWRRGSTQSDAASLQPAEQIVGYVGIWFMVDEAHIVTIAVSAGHRRRGLGEALLIASIELAERRHQESVTLECRVSNTPAQALYEKYGFRRVGIRKRYYTDNNEDALIMTTPPISDAEYQERLDQLRAAHHARHGAPRIDHPELA